MRVEVSVFFVVGPGGDPARYVAAGVWIVAGGELFAADLPGHTEATREAALLSGRLAGDIPEGFLAYWADRWPSYKGMVSAPESREHVSIEEALGAELKRIGGQ